MPFEENGIRVHFPDSNYFQLSTCAAYQAISGQGVKEMDIGWLDTSNNVLWLVEMKGYYHPSNAKYFPKDLRISSVVDSLLNELYTKSIHTLCQIYTNRAGTKSCVGQVISDQATLKLVYLIRTIPGQETYLNPMQDAIRAKLKPFIAIYRIDAITIVSYDYVVSQQLLSWVV